MNQSFNQRGLSINPTGLSRGRLGVITFLSRRSSVTTLTFLMDLGFFFEISFNFVIVQYEFEISYRAVTLPLLN